MSTDRQNSPWFVKRGLLTAAVLVVGGIALAYLAGTSFARAQLTALKLIPEPERYTELYFNHTASLPTAGTSVTFSFSIHNVTGQTKVYPYEIMLIGPTGNDEVLESGATSTTAGQIADIPVTVHVPLGTANSQIAVELPQQAQSIDFWLGKTQ